VQTSTTAPVERVFLDTNLLVYAYDRSEPEKQRRAREVLAALAAAQAGVVSAQVLAEFFVTVTRKLAAPLPVASALEQLASHLHLWKVVDVTGILAATAAAAASKYRLNYWDAQVWAAARQNQVSVVLSEDFSHGAEVEGVRFVNPFGADFCLGAW
jgi:predicted nucleic acid-binding protein